jgi:tetratricopeptide (TPR) repeat protein
MRHDSREDADVSVPDEHHDPLARIVAVAVVLATLATAFVAYRAAVASRSDDRAAADAQRLSVAALEQDVLGRQRAQLEYETFSLAERQRRRAANSLREALFRPASRKRSAELERARWDRVAKRTQQLTTITVRGPDGPEDDRAFPGDLLTRHGRGAVVATALQDAANQESVAWDSRGTKYASILTTFAVGLFLLGFTLSVPGGARLVFAGTGIILALVGSFRAVKLEVFTPARAPDGAAAAFADGEVAFQTAEKPRDAREAAVKYTEAIRLRPSFARAYYRRANAEFLAGAPEIGGSFVSATSDDSLERSLADTRKALDLGLKTFRILGSLGHQEFLLGLRNDDDGLLEDAADHARDALALNPDEPYLLSNLAVALIAQGELGEARQALDTYLQYALFRGGDRRTLRDPVLVEEVVAGTLSDLEVVRAERPELSGEVQKAKELVVGSASLGRIALGSWHGSVGKPVADVFANSLHVTRLQFERFDLERDVLSIQWYGRARRTDPWVALPQVSGVVKSAPNDQVPGQLEHDRDRSYFVQRRYVAGICLPPGDYRAELFVNGQLAVAMQAASGVSRRFQGVKLRTVDIAVCVPQEWRRDRRRHIPGVVEGVTSPDRSRGVYAVRIADAKRVSGRDPTSHVPEEVEGLLALLRGITPDGLRFVEPGVEYFAGLISQQRRWYEYPGGRALVGAGVDENGDFIMGLAYGPRRYWTGQSESSKIHDSFTRID